MEISPVSAGVQLDQIVESSAPPAKAPPPPQKVETVSPEVQALHEARAAGNEEAHLRSKVEPLNEVVSELGVDVTFSVEVSEAGDYFVRVLDEDGEEVKTIPGESFVETRERIRENIKGILEDSKN
jgi:uncharacterized FlaG/YvyC family protein